MTEISKKVLNYHKFPFPGKIRIQPTKPCRGADDLSLAYSPGVAEASLAIARNPQMLRHLTNRQNSIGILTNGTSVLGLGDVGPRAAKPVMEGKSLLFKRLANLDAFDLEISETDPLRFAEICRSLEPTFGAINLEDIQAPDCFVIEEELKQKMSIPVFHDDQHGTAVVAAAALLRALRIVKKDIHKIQMVASGAGAASLASLSLFLKLGLSSDNLIVIDRQGVLHKDRALDISRYKSPYLRETKHRTLSDAIKGADVFFGCSRGDLLNQDDLKKMAKKPIVFALANPDPEIDPELAYQTRSDLILATGRSDDVNQVNNALCFPYLFRAALDWDCREISHGMKIAAVKALSVLQKDEEIVGPYGYRVSKLLPNLLDESLLSSLCSAVAQAAVEEGLARENLELTSYKESLNELAQKLSEEAKKFPQEAWLI
jgi:malate dehydrogenase (oxaloacetate-decarboxylating)(NADP+)